MAPSLRGAVRDPDPALDFMRLLWNIEHGLQSTSKLMESDMGITGPQRLVLRIVSRSPGVSAGELARMVQLHPSTITGIVQRLVRKRLIAREHDPADSRRTRLRVCERARPLTRRRSGTVEWAVAGALEQVSSESLRHARAVLSSIAAALDDSRAARRRAAPPRRSPRRPASRPIL